MDEKWRLSLWAAAAAKDMEFAATQRSAALFVKEGEVSLTKRKNPEHMLRIFTASVHYLH